MQTATARVSHVSLDCNDFEMAHKFFRSLSAALDAEAQYSARAVRQILLTKLIALVAFKPWVNHPIYPLMTLQKLCHFERVGAMPLHSQSQTLQAEIENICVLRRLY